MCFSTERQEPDFGTFHWKSQIACQIGKQLLPSMFQLHYIATTFLPLPVKRRPYFGTVFTILAASSLAM